MDPSTLTLIREALSIGRESVADARRESRAAYRHILDEDLAKIDAALKALESFHQEVPSAQTVPVDSPEFQGWDAPRLNEVIAAHTATLARPVDATDFYGIEDAIAQALRDCEGEDPDTCSLSPKTLRRLRMALTAARGLSALADGYANAAFCAAEEGDSLAPDLIAAQQAFRAALYGDDARGVLPSTNDQPKGGA